MVVRVKYNKTNIFFVAHLVTYMKDTFIQGILKLTQAREISRTEEIQELWSGYGQIVRCFLIEGNVAKVVVKIIDLAAAASHPRGWNTHVSHQRKIQSYINESYWYQRFNNKLPKTCHTPRLLGSFKDEGHTLLVLDDLDLLGFPVRKKGLKIVEVQAVLSWLANFHAFHMGSEPVELWSVGSYWHLATRIDEWRKIEDQEIKRAAPKIDQVLNEAKYQTVIHGDAKVANFCFPENNGAVAGVDFQYAGKGVGVKDVAYFFGSCLTEEELFEWTDSLLDFYFEELHKYVTTENISVDFGKLEPEWRRLYPFAWADFTRFLLGWMPTHQKINGFAMLQMQNVLKEIKD